MDDPREQDPTAPLWESSALVTIDVQRDTLDGQPLEVPGTSAALPRIAKLCEAYRSAGLPIVHVLRLYSADGSNAERSRRAVASGPVPVFRPGTSGRSLAPEILPPGSGPLDDDALLAGELHELGPHEVAMYKPRWGAFYETPLHQHLQALGVTTAVFAGCNFPNCPRTSVYEASERDYRVGLASDATSGLYDRGTTELKGIGIHLLTTPEIATLLDLFDPLTGVARSKNVE